MANYGDLLKWMGSLLAILFFISLMIGTDSSLDEELEVYKNMKENYNQSHQQNERTDFEEDYNSETNISTKKKSVPLTHTFARIFGSFWIIVLTVGMRITARILKHSKRIP